MRSDIWSTTGPKREVRRFVMRFIHTADWHLGRIFHNVHLTEDQAYVLDKFIEVVQDARPDVVIIAGDIYDRAVPPQDAVSLLDDVLSRLVGKVGVPVVLIAGNHDSPERLSFGARILANSNLHVFGPLLPECRPVVLEDDFGPVNIYAIPFAEPSVVRERLGEDDIRDHDSALRQILHKIRAKQPTDRRSILVAHAAVVGSRTSDSERPLSIGGSETVEPAIFDGFNYVALGHLHQPQSSGKDHIQYSGSIMKYSFSEASHQKSVTIVEMDAIGKCTIERINLSPRRDVRRIEGTMEDILKKARSDENKDDYIMVTLLDRQPVLNAMGRLREVYPNTLHIERPMFTSSAVHARAPADHLRLSEVEMFSSFFSQVTGEEMTETETQVFVYIIENLRRREREAT